ncbi:MAG: glycosyltransferase [Paracoccus denitrificans]|uniref:Glycosyltransferase n=1 Tax=Paracoccus denitrificans TaxID=266 RepID=A0A533I2N7_PARDE|nr:MAG: glycosyltransferase [Paracoccus denitrificans]
MARVMIGLALFQGAEHIAAQLASIARQTHTDWRLVASDDGSKDDGPRMLREFAAARPKGQVELVEGPRKGATANFLSLLDRAEPTEFVAFADQDDVWNEDKLERAFACLSANNAAGLYCARTTICDEQLNPLVASRHFKGPFNFNNALIQALTAGNTLLLPPDTVALLRRSAPAAISAGIESHDWWIYQMVSGAGLGIFRDEQEVLLYRQHGDNLKGRNDTFRAMATRLAQLFSGDYASWLHANVTALLAAEHELTPDNRAALHRFAKALYLPGPRMAIAMRRLGVRRQTAAGNTAFYAAALAGRLRRRAG